MTQPTAAIVVIGDEILRGKFVEENASFAIGALRDLGIALHRISVIRDHIPTIAKEVFTASTEVDYVFTSGGVGPTHDDITMDGIAQGFGVSVVVDKTLEDLVRNKWGQDAPPAALRLAHTPQGSRLHAGPSPMWPTVIFRNIVILPGVPVLFRKKFVSFAQTIQGSPVYTESVRINSEEHNIAESLSTVAATFPGVKIGSYPRFDENPYYVIVTFEGENKPSVNAAKEKVTQTLAVFLAK